MPKILIVASLLLLVLAHTNAFEQGQPPRPAAGDLVDESIPRAACSECQPHVDRIKELQRLRRYARNRLRFFEQQPGIFPEEIGWVFSALTAAEPAIADYTARINQALIELTACNQTCGERQPTGGTGSTGQTPTPANPPITSTCPDCDRIVEDLQAAENRRKEIAEELEHYRNEAQAKVEEYRSKQNALRELRRNGRGNTPEAFDLETDINLLAGRGSSMQTLFDSDPYVRELQQRLSSAESESARLKQKLEDCQKYCKPKETSGIFRTPLFLGAAVATIAGGVLVSGRDTTLPTPATLPSVTLPSTPTTPQPAPTRRPAALINVSGCICVDNSAILDAILQLCQRLRQIRTSGSGNSMTLTGDAPLPAFQGTFNDSTFAFELTTTTTVGTMTANVVIAGTVEMNGNLSNLRVAFAATSGRHTLYSLTTAPVSLTTAPVQ